MSPRLRVHRLPQVIALSMFNRGSNHADHISDRTRRCTSLWSLHRRTSPISQHFRPQDETLLYPICGRFNATERAIRKVRREFIECGIPRTGLEYAQAIDATLDWIISELS